MLRARRSSRVAARGPHLWPGGGRTQFRVFGFETYLMISILTLISAIATSGYLIAWS